MICQVVPSRNSTYSRRVPPREPSRQPTRAESLGSAEAPEPSTQQVKTIAWGKLTEDVRILPVRDHAPLLLPQTREAGPVL